MARLFRSLAITALLTVLASSACLADRTVRVRSPSDLAKNLGSMPRIVEPRNAAERKVNAAVARLDASVRKASTACRKDGGARSSWERNVSVPMRGPRFISYRITDNVFCGGAHPSVGTMAIVYDLATGLPVDWSILLPLSFTDKVTLSTAMDGTRTVTLESKRLHALYLERYRPKTGKPNVDAPDDECRDAVTQAGNGEAPGMIVWLDAKQGGLAARFEVSHAVQACVDDVVIPSATLRAEGAEPVLIGAIEAAHSAWQGHEGP